LWVLCVCCHVEVSATGWSLVKRNPTDCVLVCDHETSRMRRPKRARVVNAGWKKKMYRPSSDVIMHDKETVF
jgi:hypothetical protein